MGLGAILGTARDGMMAHAAALDVTGQNVANVETPGYAQRSAVLASRAQPGHAGGVEVSTFARQAAVLAGRRVHGEAGKLAAAGARAEALGRLQEAAAPSSGGLAERLAAFTAAATTLSVDPSSSASRSAFLARAGDVAQGFASAAATIGAERTALLEQAGSVVGDVNASLAKIAAYNAQIAAGEASGHPALDLRDARDVLGREVATAIGGQIIEDDRGQWTVLAAGSALVSGGSARALALDLDSAGQMRVRVLGAGGSSVDTTAQVDSGTLGGIRRARDEDMPRALAKLDALAFDFASSVNARHSAGFGLDGATGRALFAQPAQATGAAAAFSVDAQLLGQPGRLAAAASAAELPGGGGAALALADLGHTPLAGGSTTASERVTQWVAQIGSDVAGAQRDASLRASTLQAAEAHLEAQRGVSLDEEMVNLSRYQRAFEASARVLKVVDELMRDLVREF